MIELLLTLIAQDRDMKMTEVATGLHEEVPGGALLIVAYGVIVTLVLGFVARLAIKQMATEAALDALEKAAADEAAPRKE